MPAEEQKEAREKGDEDGPGTDDEEADESEDDGEAGARRRRSDRPGLASASRHST